MVSACEQAQPVAPPPPPQAQSFMVFFDWDRSNLSPQAVNTGTQAAAAWEPKSYCKALSDKFREYRTAQATNVEAAAIARCEAGDYAAGIPVLEDSLITAKIPLPNPGYRWPGRPV